VAFSVARTLAANAKENAMPLRLLVMATILLLSGHTMAGADDRPLTDEERAKLGAAVQAEGCAGGEMEVDDGRYEVDDAKCADGRQYDLRFDQTFKLIGKGVND
jgi:hypothetical protein